MHLFTCWIQHSSLSGAAQLIVVLTARAVFNDLDSSPRRVKQMFAAEVTRLETESCDKSVQRVASRLLRERPEIRQL